MMDEKSGTVETVRAVKKARPALMTLLCLFSFTYFSVLPAIFLFLAFWSGRIAAISNLYIPGYRYSGARMLIIFLSGLILHLAALAGTYLVWTCRRTGLYIATLACTAIMLFLIFIPGPAIGSIGVYLILAICFLLCFRRLH